MCAGDATHNHTDLTSCKAILLREAVAESSAGEAENMTARGAVRQLGLSRYLHSYENRHVPRGIQFCGSAVVKFRIG